MIEKTYLPHQQRVVDEKAALDDNREKLAAFAHTEIFSGLPKDEQNRLDHQGFHMGAYSDILAQRIANF